MGFTGRPSLACAVCKQRKKKCDRTRPNCRQCLSIGRHCPGIPEEIDRVFRNQFMPQAKDDTPLTSFQNAKERVKIHDGMAESAVHSEYNLQYGKLGIPPAMSVDWLSTATTYYLNLHCQVNLPTRRMNPWLDIEAEYFTAQEPGSVSRHAVAALAAMTMAREMRIPELAEMAARPYGRALRAVNHALADATETSRNDIAVSIYVLTCYELRHTDVNRRQRYQVHTEGLKRLLVLRGRQQLLDSASLRVFRALRASIVYNYVIRSEVLIRGEDDMIWTYNNPCSTTPVDELMAIAALVANLRAMVRELAIFGSDSKTDDLVHHASEVERKLNQWFLTWHDLVKFDILVSPERGDDFWHQRAHIFTDLSFAALMNHYYLLKVLVLDALHKGRKSSGSLGQRPTVQDVYSNQICEMMDHICYSVPFITGEMHSTGSALSDTPQERWTYTSLTEAIWVLLPLVVVAQHEAASQHQKSWLRQQLVRLNHDFGLFDIGALPPTSNDKSYLF